MYRLPFLRGLDLVSQQSNGYLWAVKYERRKESNTNSITKAIQSYMGFNGLCNKFHVFTIMRKHMSNVRVTVIQHCGWLWVGLLKHRDHTLPAPYWFGHRSPLYTPSPPVCWKGWWLCLEKRNIWSYDPSYSGGM